MRGDTHRRGRLQESGRSRWILSSEMGHVAVLGSSTWMWPMLRTKHVNTISEEDKNDIPKLVRAMQLNIRCTKDEWLVKSTVTSKPRRRIRCAHLNIDVNMVYVFPLSGWWVKWAIIKGRRTGICHATHIPTFTAAMP